MNEIRMRLGKKSKSSWKQMEMNSHNPKLMGHSEYSPERKVHKDTGLPEKDRNISSKQPNSMRTRTPGTTTKTVQSK